MVTAKVIQLGVGAVVFHEDRILLVKRRNPPNQNQWAIPGGRVRYGEPIKQAVAREILEETGIVIQVGEPIYTFEVIHNDPTPADSRHYVVIDYIAEFVSGNLIAADDALEAAWVDRNAFHQLTINDITRNLLREKYDYP